MDITQGTYAQLSIMASYYNLKNRSKFDITRLLTASVSFATIVRVA